MRRGLAVLGSCLALSLAASASAGSLELRGGASFPRAQSNLFADNAELYTRSRTTSGRPPGVGKGDWRGFTGGIEFNVQLANNLEMGFHVDGSDRTLQTSYRDFVRDNNREIAQSLKLSVVPVGVSLRIVPTSRRARFAPYAAVGADLVYWKYEEFGDFIDFDSTRRPRPIIDDSFISEGVAAGFHVAGGLRVAVSDDVSLTSEARYLWARDDMGDDFRGNRIDLSGFRTTVGVNIRF